MLAYLFGMMWGLMPAFSTGPVFLTLVQHSIDHGFKKTIFFIVGVALADTTIIAVTWYGLSRISGNSDSPWLSIIGGLLLIGFGIGFLLKKEKTQKETKSSKKHLQKAGLFMQGIMLNSINPIIWAFWAGMSNLFITEFSTSQQQLTAFAGMLSTIWATDLLKAFYGQKLKTLLRESFQKYLRWFIAGMLIVFGSKMIIQWMIQ